MGKRLTGFDYSRPMFYMVTLKCRRGVQALCEIIAPGKCQLNAITRAMVACIRNFHLGCGQIAPIECFSIMPDHIHMIVRITEDLPEGKHLGHIVAGFKGGCSRAWWRLASTSASNPAASTTTPAASAAGSPAPSPSLFESGYNDLILLDDGQLDNWKHYLDDNPRRLAIKRLRPDFFTTLNYADIAEWHCQLVGNSFLLDIPQKVAVIVHTAYTDKQYADYCEKWLACGEAGGVLVSAAIAPREKEVMREAMNRGYRIILVRENGFPPLYKPAGESFDACSDGRFLQVSPWEYHMEHRRISREQCLMLNRLVEDIVDYVPVSKTSITC